MMQQRKRREIKKGEVSQPSLEASLIRRARDTCLVEGVMVDLKGTKIEERRPENGGDMAYILEAGWVWVSFSLGFSRYGLAKSW
jgi:hypothetical protein